MPFRLATSFAVLGLALTLVGCDAVADREPYDGVVEVALAQPYDEAEIALRLVAVEDAGCRRALLTSLESGAARRRVVVEGLGNVGGTTCEALIPASAIVVLNLGPELPGGYVIEVQHAGATDLYQLDVTGRVAVLTAVHTSTTRLAD